MASLEGFIFKIKPALDAFLRDSNKSNLEKLDHELQSFDWIQMKIFNVQILVPLITKLDQLNNQDLKTGVINCIRFVTSKIYLKDEKGLRTVLVVVLKQIYDGEKGKLRPDLSEELKLAAVESFTETLRRTTTDVLEKFYTEKSVPLCGQLLLILVQLIEQDKYKKLITAAINCIMAIFYVHDDVDFMDIVLRNQVADMLFMFLPKILLVLERISLSDETRGENLKSLAIKALGRILCIMYDQTNETVTRTIFDMGAFKDVLQEIKQNDAKTILKDNDITGPRCKNRKEAEERLKRLKDVGRSSVWFEATSRKVNFIFQRTNNLRSHESRKIRYECANMCCTLMERCAYHLKDNFTLMLENVIALSDDVDEQIKNLCKNVLNQLQESHSGNTSIFDESSEVIFDEHIIKLPRIIMRCDDAEQFTELKFLKAFFQNLSAEKLLMLLSLSKNLDMICICLISVVSLNISRDLLIEEYALKEISSADFEESKKLKWRQFKNLSSNRCIETVKDICIILGKTKLVNRILYDYFTELIAQQNSTMNEILLIMMWMAAEQPKKYRENRKELVLSLLDEIFEQQHWHLALRPDRMQRLKVDKPTNWFADYTPGLYESAYEIRVQDCDSGDENEDNKSNENVYVTIADAQFNVMHTCIILDALGHCALFLGDTFDKYVFRSLHNVLLKAASSNTIIYQAASFALISMQKALRFNRMSDFIQSYTDYISYHLTTILKRSPESKSAVDILTVVLQYGTSSSLPHLQNIFETIFSECSKIHQTKNLNSYLKVFHCFLIHATSWQSVCDNEIKDIPMEIENEEEEIDLVTEWLNLLKKPALMSNSNANDSETFNSTENETTETDTKDEFDEKEDEQKENLKIQLPTHIEMIKRIVCQVTKFLSSKEQSYQIQALECLIVSIPLLKEYENELLPLVHLLWEPLIEKFRQKDAIVLNRCFTLLNVLATHAKDFILKRSLRDVIPYLKQFLKVAAKHSATEQMTAQTQEYKLQIKLLEEFPNLIQSMEIDGKYLNDICEVVAFYLSKNQPTELQDLAMDFYKLLQIYNGPLVYLIVMKKSYIEEFQVNATKLLTVLLN